MPLNNLTFHHLGVLLALVLDCTRLMAGGSPNAPMSALRSSLSLVDVLRYGFSVTTPPIVDLISAGGGVGMGDGVAIAAVARETTTYRQRGS
jgi:hypothetical protein